jgi:PAS domain S-box-containing protein
MIREINLTGAELLGQARRYLKGSRFTRFVEPAQRNDFQRFCKRLFDSGRREELEIKLLPRQQAATNVLLSGIVVHDGQDNLNLCQMAMTDISARTKAEEELRNVSKELEIRVQQQSAVAQIGRRALAGADLPTLLQEASEIVAKALDLDLCKVLELLPDGRNLILRAGVGWRPGLVGRATVEAGLDSQAGYTILHNEPVIVTDARTETRFRTAPLLVEHGAVCGVSAVIRGRDRPFGVLGGHSARRRDFTQDDIYLMESVANVLGEAIELEKDELWRKKLIETTQDAIISINRRSLIVLFNPAAEKIFGYSAGEIAGKKVNVLMGEPYASEHDGYLTRYEQTGEARAIGRVRTVTARRKTGELFAAELSVCEVDSHDEVRYVAFIRDVSEKTKLQADLLERARLASIGETAAKVTHEIANPLNGISMSMELLERRLLAAADDAGMSVLKRITGEVSRLKNLLYDFRDLSREPKYSRGPTSMGEIIEDVCRLEDSRYAAQGIQVQLDIAPVLPLVLVDRDKMKQVLLNLCKNAEEAMPDGGTLTLRAYEAKEQAVVEVRDTGTGIPEDIDIFAPFKTTKVTGSGLGLVIARQIVAAHQGSLTYTSELGKGTSFFLSLPAIGRSDASRVED